MPEGENDGTRHPFEVVGELSMKAGPEQPTPVVGAVKVGAFVIGGWDDADENPLQAIARLNTEAIEANRQVEYLRAELRANIDEREAARASLRQERHQSETAIQALQDFRRRVRDKAIEVAAEQDWCRPGLNEVLRDLGLPEHDPRFKVPLRVRAYQTVWVEVSASDEEDAIEEAEHNLGEGDLELAEDGWQVDDWTKAEWDSVEAVQPEWD